MPSQLLQDQRKYVSRSRSTSPTTLTNTTLLNTSTHDRTQILKLFTMPRWGDENESWLGGHRVNPSLVVRRDPNYVPWQSVLGNPQPFVGGRPRFPIQQRHGRGYGADPWGGLRPQYARAYQPYTYDWNTRQWSHSAQYPSWYGYRWVKRAQS